MSGDHPTENDPPSSIIDRRSGYRQNGHDYIVGLKARLDVYNTKGPRIQNVLLERGTRPSPAGPKPGSKEHAARYAFDYEQNFKRGQSPYSNQAHHLIPVSAFDFPPFSEDMRTLLRRCQGYDVNEGANIIFLASTLRASEMHDLPAHSGDHPKYTDQVKTDLQSIADALQESLDGKKHVSEADPPTGVPKQLRGIQKDYWNLLVNTGSGITVNEAKKEGR